MVRPAIAAALTMVSVAGASQSPSRPQAAKWQIDWGEQRCTLLRRIEGATPITFALRMIPGRTISELILVNPSWKKDVFSTYQPVSISFDDNAEEPLTAGGMSLPIRGAGRSVMVDALPYEFKDRFSHSTKLEVSLPGKPPFASISYSQADKAVAALLECDKGLLRSWGIDFAEAERLKQGAQWQVERMDVFKPSDYPKSALENLSSGTVVITFTIGLDGRAKDCKTVGTSGDHALDDTTCAVLTERARFTPAIGADGRPSESKAVETVNWVVRHSLTPPPRVPGGSLIKRN